MSATKERIPLAEAKILADEVIQLLEASCHRIEIAGSIRRQKPEVGDVEIICIPKIEPGSLDLFGEPSGQVSRQYDLVCDLKAQVIFEDRTDKNGVPSCGWKAQRLRYKGFAVDIFPVIAPAQYGVVKLIRTGPSDFSHRFVTPWAQGGEVLRAGLLIREGALYDLGVLVETPEEEDLFRAVGRSFIPARDRT